MGNSTNTSKLPNILWIIVDSVRNYHTDSDDRGRIDIIDTLAKKGVEFTTAVTSAPSTIMSTSAMMTSVPAIYHSLIYDGFNSNARNLNTIQSILSQNGYKVFNTVFFPEGRSYLKPMIGDICEKYWPNHLNPSHFWSNENINEILENLLLDNLPEPYFLYLNYNCRHDPETSNKVEHGLSMLEKNGSLKNTIIIINSDHGYPDPKRGISFSQMRELGHDLIMTDDNILAPLVFVVPGVSQKSISKPVSLLDIAPTIIDLVGLNGGKLRNEHETGISLKSLILGKNTEVDNRIHRIDNRYICQKRRVSALRDSTHKYIYDIDKNEEFFFDVNIDTLELNNLIDSPQKLNEVEKFRSVFQHDELAIKNHHISFVKQRLQEIINKNDTKVAILESNDSILLELLKTGAKELGIKLKHINSKDISDTQRKENLRITESKKQNSAKYLYDVCILILPGNNPRTHRRLFSLAKRANAQKLVILNENLTVISKPRNWIIISILILFKKLIPKLRVSPKTFFVDSVLGVRLLLGK